MSYNGLTRQHFAHPDCAGEAAGPGWFRGSAGSRAQGTWVQFDIEVGPIERARDRTIREVRFRAFGCPHVIAVAQYLSLAARGRAVEPGLPEDVSSLRERFAVPVEKLGRLLTVEDAWAAALRALSRDPRGPI